LLLLTPFAILIDSVCVDLELEVFKMLINLSVSTGTYTVMASMPWIQFGIATCICMGVMLVHSLTWLRRKYYDAFLVIHIVLAIVILVGIFQ
jgi:hypothetical protein